MTGAPRFSGAVEDIINQQPGQDAMPTDPIPPTADVPDAKAWSGLMHDYNRLVWRSYGLTVRLKLLQGMLAVVAPIATPGLLLLMRTWFDRLARDVDAFGRTARAIRRRIAEGRAELARHREVPNPWV